MVAQRNAGSVIVDALSDAWEAIRTAHPDTPEAVLVVASGSAAGRGMLKLGHYAHARWVPKATRDRKVSEVLIGGEGLQRGGRETLGTLLHEAAHGIAATRGVKDTSRDGRYHNKAFAKLANEVGLDVEPQGTRGHAATSVSDATAKRWKREIEALDKALLAFRLQEEGGKKRAKSRQLLAMCECERKIRLSRETFEAAPITCGACETDFKLEDDDGDED